MIIRQKTLTCMMFAAGLISVSPLTAHALGFGPAKVVSEIGQPFRAEVPLKLSGTESFETIGIVQAPTSEYERQSVGFHSSLSNLRVNLRVVNGASVAILTTLTAVNEPYLQFILQGDTPQGRMSKSFNVQIPTSALAKSFAKATAVSSAAVTVKEAVVEAAKADEVKQQFDTFAAQGNALYDYVIESGTRPNSKSIARVNARGKNESVVTALSKIVPKQWKGFASDGAVHKAKPLTWEGGHRLWIEVVNEVLAASNMSAALNWAKKEITFSGQSAVEEPLPVKVVASENAAASVAAAPAPAQPEPVAQVVPMHHHVHESAKLASKKNSEIAADNRDELRDAYQSVKLLEQESVAANKRLVASKATNELDQKRLSDWESRAASLSNPTLINLAGVVSTNQTQLQQAFEYRVAQEVRVQTAEQLVAAIRSESALQIALRIGKESNSAKSHQAIASQVISEFAVERKAADNQKFAEDAKLLVAQKAVTQAQAKLDKSIAVFDKANARAGKSGIQRNTISDGKNLKEQAVNSERNLKSSLEEAEKADVTRETIHQEYLAKKQQMMAFLASKRAERGVDKGVTPEATPAYKAPAIAEPTVVVPVAAAAQPAAAVIHVAAPVAPAVVAATSVVVVAAPAAQAPVVVVAAPAAQAPVVVVAAPEAPAEPVHASKVVSYSIMFPAGSFSNVDIYKNAQVQGGNVRSSGFNVSLYKAVNLIAPKGWATMTQDPLLVNIQTASWRGADRSWVEVLNEIMIANHAKAFVNPISKEIVLTSAP